MAEIRCVQRRDGIRWIVRLNRTSQGKSEFVSVSFTDKMMALEFVSENEDKYKRYGYTGIDIPTPRERGLKSTCMRV